jgi:hypothetical protein
MKNSQITHHMLHFEPIEVLTTEMVLIMLDLGITSEQQRREFLYRQFVSCLRQNINIPEEE